jgi:hypothetical protein
MANQNDNKNLGLFAVIFAAIFGSLYGIFNIAKKVGERNQSSNQLAEIIKQGMQEGLSDKEMIGFCEESASKQFGRPISIYEKERISKAYFGEKEKIVSSEWKVSPKVSISEKDNTEIKRLEVFIDEKLIEGMNEVTLTNMILMDASEKMGDEFTENFSDKIKCLVLVEKVRLKDEGKI